MKRRAGSCVSSARNGPGYDPVTDFGALAVDLFRTAFAEILLPLAGWVGGLALASLVVGLLLSRWSRGRLDGEPRTAGRSLALGVVALTNLVLVPLAAALFAVPFALQRSVADLFEVGAPSLVALTVQRGETLWLEGAGLQPELPLPPLDELHSHLDRMGAPGSEPPVTGSLSITRLGEVAAVRFREAMTGALETLEASGADTWGEAVAAVRPSVEARLIREARSIGTAFRRGAWLELLPAIGLAAAAWFLTGILVLLIGRPSGAQDTTDRGTVERGLPTSR